MLSEPSRLLLGYRLALCDFLAVELRRFLAACSTEWVAFLGHALSFAGIGGETERHAYCPLRTESRQALDRAAKRLSTSSQFTFFMNASMYFAAALP